ncbi:PREDICTED: integrator complex subunit 5, partial [Calidris pugnax]|uniref:integrator complex subunit 5 n=1 Tax=Calidris pugnax TaxID=198806 RepID=UPI00071D5324
PPPSAQELAQEVKAFLSGVDPVQGTKLSLKDHARCALLLLRCLPPARHAALEHLRLLFDEQVCSHLLQRENLGGGSPHFNRPSSGGTTLPPGGGGGGGGGSGLEEVVQEVQKVLGEFVRANPKSWAPLVSAWSIELMGQLSSKYSGRHGVPQASSLNELLQLWMSCEATRSLMEIYTQCLSAMIGGGPDACVDALLDTSLQHSPHFDWVVAHIGSSFPSTIINRVLSCGLKDFCAHGGVGGGTGGSSTTTGDPLFVASLPPQPEKRPPKIASVVGILGHLASRHSGSIKQELLRMFHQSLGAGGGREQQQKATVPFLLQLALMSPPLLATVTPELVDSLKPPLLNQLHQHFAPLPREELDHMLGVVVHLLSQTSAGAYRILQFLVNTATPASVITPPICRLFRQHPLLFPLLRLVAAGPPALCYCSPLLRGLLGSLVAYWESCRDTGTTSSPWHLQASCSLVAAMAEGSLLPPVLGDMHELFPHLAPFEVHLLLLSLWEYLRENAPLPQKFTFQTQKGLFRRDFARDGDVGKHLGVLHSVLHKNIHRLGLLAARFR